MYQNRWREEGHKYSKFMSNVMSLSSHYVTIVLTQKRRRRFKKYMYYVNVIVSETRKSLTYMVSHLYGHESIFGNRKSSHLYGLPHKSKSQFENDKWPPTSILLRIRNPLRFQVLENSGILIWRSKYPKKNRALRARLRPKFVHARKRTNSGFRTSWVLVHCIYFSATAACEWFDEIACT